MHCGGTNASPNFAFANRRSPFNFNWCSFAQWPPSHSTKSRDLPLKGDASRLPRLFFKLPQKDHCPVLRQLTNFCLSKKNFFFLVYWFICKVVFRKKKTPVILESRETRCRDTFESFLILIQLFRLFFASEKWEVATSKGLNCWDFGRDQLFSSIRNQSSCNRKIKKKREREIFKVFVCCLPNASTWLLVAIRRWLTSPAASSFPL